MDNLFNEFTKEPDKHFYAVIALHEAVDLDWNTLKEKIPLLPRGWFELSRLPKRDRVEFTGAHWLSKLGDVQRAFFEVFFRDVEDIQIWATQATPSLPFELHMIYCLKDNQRFFHGSPPADVVDVNNLKRQFSEISFPSDYLDFLTIHDGFNRYTDRGIIKTHEMARTYLRFQKRLDSYKADSKSPFLYWVPFYEAVVPYAYQCFCLEDTGEIKSAFFSEHGGEGRVFHTFLDWLVSYLGARCI